MAAAPKLEELSRTLRREIVRARPVRKTGYRFIGDT